VTRPFRQGRFSELPERPRRPHAFFELPLREIEVRSDHFGAVNVAFRELGDGPPLLLVHGLMTTGYSFRYLMPLLADRFRVIAPDLVGCGRSGKPERRYPPGEVAAFIGDLQRALDVRGCDVVGNSMGGYLCMQLALDDVGAMRRLVNIHSPGAPLARLYALRAAMALPGADALLRRLVLRDPLRWAHRNVHYRDESLKSLEEAREYGDPLAARPGCAAFARYLGDTLDPFAMRRFVARLARDPFPVPLSLVYATTDPMVPPVVGERLAKLLPGAELHWLEESSHFAHVESPERIADLVSRFLARDDRR
jgi:pimeloyl-ACP methyl ester carboxylesterase